MLGWDRKPVIVLSEGPVDPGTGGWAIAMPGLPGPAVKPPARRRGKSRVSRMLDWDATA